MKQDSCSHAQLFPCEIGANTGPRHLLPCSTFTQANDRCIEEVHPLSGAEPRHPRPTVERVQWVHAGRRKWVAAASKGSDPMMVCCFACCKVHVESVESKIQQINLIGVGTTDVILSGADSAFFSPVCWSPFSPKTPLLWRRLVEAGAILPCRDAGRRTPEGTVNSSLRR